MFSQDNIKRLQDISRRIGYILLLCEEKGGVSLALQDSISSQPAIMMHMIKDKIDKQLESIKEA